MGIASTFVLSLVVFLTLHFGVLPVQRRAMENDLTREAIKSFTRYHLFAILRTVTLACLIGMAVVIVAIWLMGLGGTATVDEVAKTLASFRMVRGWAEAASSNYSIAMFVLLTSGLVWLSYKQSKQQATALFEKIENEERERLIEAYKNEEWEELQANDLMVKVEEIFNAKRDELESAHAQGDTAAAKALEEEIEELRGIYFSVDLSRRMLPKFSAPLSEDLVLPVSARWSDKMRNAVLNRGILKTFQGGSRVLLFLALIALLPSATAISLVAGGASLDAHIVRLDELQLSLDSKEADRMLAEALARSSDEVQPPVGPEQEAALDDETATEQIIASYDQAFTQQIFRRSLSLATRNTVDRSTVREAILKDYAQSSRRPVEAVAGMEGAEPTILDDARAKARSHLEKIRTENRKAWDNLVRSLPTRADFGTQVERSDLRRVLTGNILNTAFAGDVPDLAVAYEAHAKRYFSSLVDGSSFTKAGETAFRSKDHVAWTSHTEEKLKALQPHTDSGGEFFDRSVHQNPPTLRLVGQDAQEIQSAERILSSMSSEARSAHALYAYEDILPGRLGDETRTSAAKVSEHLEDRNLTGGGGGGGGGGGKSSPHTGGGGAKPSVAAFQRSYSYHSLRGFSRVGGVLIGRPPENEKSTLDIRDISWSSVPGQGLSLTMMNSAGKRDSFGPYPVSLVRQALAYAADQRPLAVTMITAEPVPDLKIIAHPALVDTAVGCRAVQIDRVTDEATSGAEYRAQAEAVAQVADALYQYTWGAVVAKRVPDSGFSSKENYAIEKVANAAITRAKQKLAMAYVKYQPAVAGADVSPVKAKKGFYDPLIGDAALKCAKESKNFSAFEACAGTASSPSSLEQLLKRLPTFQIWSGVRELPYSQDPDLAFLRQPKGNNLWPFDFILQVAFTRQGLIGDDEVIDEAPWEFPALHDRLLKDVGDHVKANPRLQALVRDMRDFVVVQRIFRSALNGQFGNQFPIAKLAKLSREINAVRTADAGYKTPKWNSRELERPIQQSFALIALKSEGHSPQAQELVRVAMSAFESCSASVPTAKSSKVKVACRFDQARKLAQSIQSNSKASADERSLADAVIEFAGILDLRREFRVYSAENMNASTCPAL